MSETRFFYSEKTLTIVLGELSTFRRMQKRLLYYWLNRKSERKTDLAKKCDQISHFFNKDLALRQFRGNTQQSKFNI